MKALGSLADTNRFKNADNASPSRFLFSGDEVRRKRLLEANLVFWPVVDTLDDQFFGPSKRAEITPSCAEAD